MARKKIALIGAGQIGGALALLAAQKELGDVVIVDITEGVPDGKALDLSQAATIEGNNAALIGGNDMGLIKDSDVVIVTAGLPRKPGMSRDDLIGVNTNIIKQVGQQIKDLAPDSFVIVVTNPLDVMVWVMQQVTGFDPARVVGMAGILDGGRFRTFLSQELNVSPEDVQTLLLGGHGDLMVPLPRFTSVAGIPLPELVSMGWISHQRVDEIIARTRDGGAEIVQLLKTGSAFYAPAAAAILMAESFLKDQKRVVTCAAHLDGEYGQRDVYAGVPVILGAGGVEKVIQLPLNEEEQSQFDSSVKAVQNLIDVARRILRPN